MLILLRVALWYILLILLRVALRYILLILLRIALRYILLILLRIALRYILLILLRIALRNILSVLTIWLIRIIPGRSLRSSRTSYLSVYTVILTSCRTVDNKRDYAKQTGNAEIKSVEEYYSARRQISGYKAVKRHTEPCRSKQYPEYFFLYRQRSVSECTVC